MDQPSTAARIAPTSGNESRVSPATGKTYLSKELCIETRITSPKKVGLFGYRQGLELFKGFAGGFCRGLSGLFEEALSGFDECLGASRLEGCRVRVGRGGFRSPVGEFCAGFVWAFVGLAK